MPRRTVYVSSTFKDLEAHRAAVKIALERAGYDVESMERYPAFDERPSEKCLADVVGCDYYVLVLAHRYGFVPPADNPQGKSITHLEYDQACAAKRPVLPFVIDETHAWRPDWIDRGEPAEKLKAFQRAIEQRHGRGTFSGPDSLASAVLQALAARENERRAQASARRRRVGSRRGAAPVPALSILPINGMGMNVVRGVEDNEEPNGSFACHLALLIAPNEPVVDVCGFEALYYAYGCPALQRRPSLEIAGTLARLMGDWQTLVQPVRLPPTGITVRYSRDLRPPLMEDCPADCDYGDVKVRITYRILGEEKLTTSERCYRFGPGGKLAAIDAVRPVPRLHDDELRRCLAVGRLDRQAFQALSALDPIDRYMGARSEVGENFIPLNHMLETLRGILHAPCVQDSEPTQAGGHA